MDRPIVFSGENKIQYPPAWRRKSQGKTDYVANIKKKNLCMESLLAFYCDYNCIAVLLSTNNG